MKVTFIAHAGFYIEQDDYGVIIDPWFFGSDIKSPIVQGIWPDSRTIDFQMPRPVSSIDQFRPQTILFSHLHTHHSPLKEVRRFLSYKDKKVTLAMPSLPKAHLGRLRRHVGKFKNAEYLKAVNKKEFVRGPFTLKPFLPINPWHAVWLISSAHGSILHIADSPINKNPWSRHLDAGYEALRDLRPDLLLITANGTNTKMRDKKGRFIWENANLSPLEGARLTAWIKPKRASVIGMYNHSMWTGGLEMSLPPYFVEEEFRWAVNYLSPETKVQELRPGDVLNIQTSESDSSVDNINSNQAIEKLKALHLNQVPHSGGNFLDHLVGTYSLLKKWGEREEVCLGGLGHSVYGTEVFDVVAVSRRERSRVVKIVGRESENLCYLFSAMVRNSLWRNLKSKKSYSIVNRFNKRSVRIGEQTLRDLFVISLANILEQQHRLPRGHRFPYAEEFHMARKFLSPTAYQAFLNSYSPIFKFQRP